jgi:diguanylate cyclase (GGDEF)-like protein
MKTETETQSKRTTEVVEHLEDEQIDLKIVRWAAGERELSSEQRQRLDQLRKERGEHFCSDLLFTLLGRRYPQMEAQSMWNQIIEHRDVLTRMLSRNPGIVVAALDWLSNLKADETMELSLIEYGKLEKILERAVVDGLTGLYDHDTLLALLKKEIERARRHTETLSLLLFDLDDFKQVNDKYGHQKGDEVLARLADIIRETIRTMDIAGRYGGEEFAVILPETDVIEARQSAERLSAAIEQSFRQDVQLTISVGIACFPDHGKGVDALVKKADEALYQAKAEGKNRVVVFQC